MDTTLIAIAFFILLAIVLLLVFLFNSNKKSYIADNGTVFDNKSDLELYEDLYVKTKPLFSLEVQQSANNQILGFDNTFLTKLTKDGFLDLVELIKYRKQLKLLSDLINT